MKKRSVATAVASMVIALSSALTASQASAAWTSGCISGTACFRKGSTGVQYYTSSSDSNTLGDWIHTAPADSFRQRMNAYEFWTYEFANYGGLLSCDNPEGSAAPWRWYDGTHAGSIKVIDVNC